jgi:L-ascorbate metabolism protein UlaG (beta-lactamase superfamily)
MDRIPTRWPRRAATLCIVAAVVGGALLGWRLASPVPAHAGPRSDHFDGRQFFNDVPVARSFTDFLRWRLTREGSDPWRIDLTPPVVPPPPTRVPGAALRVTWINHATVLIQTASLNLLTDPIWSGRASPLGWLGPRRHLAVGVAFPDLPPVDVVMLSHNHYDHMDLPSLARLAERDNPLFAVPLGNCLYLERIVAEGRCREFDWWESFRPAPGVTVHAVPARHWSRRNPFDTSRALWGGWLVEAAQRIYFAGDTGAGPHFAAIRDRLGAPDLAILPIGAFLPRWFMAPQHLSPEEAVAAAAELDARAAMAMHHACFNLADNGQWQPLHELAAALADGRAAGIDFWAPAHGEAREWTGSAVATR